MLSETLPVVTAPVPPHMGAYEMNRLLSCLFNVGVYLPVHGLLLMIFIFLFFCLLFTSVAYKESPSQCATGAAKLNAKLSILCDM